MVMDLQKVPDFDYYRERKIDLEDKSVVPGATKAPAVSKEMTAALYGNMGKVLSKVDRLLDEIKKNAPPRIPVHEQAVEVRLALRNLYPGQPADYITYLQYLDCIEYENKFYNFDPTKVIDLLTGDPSIDSRLLSQTMQESGTGMKPDEWMLLGGHFAFLMVLNRILQTFQAPNTQKAVAGKMPPGTETAATLVQVLIGLAAILLQTAITEKEAAKSLESTFGEFLSTVGTSADSIVESAKNQPPDTLMSNYSQSREGEYRANIKQYSDIYVINNPGYETWVASDDVHEIREDLRASVREEKNYATNLYNMGSEIYRVSLCGLDRSNDRINKIAAVLSHKYTKDMLCCFARFIVAIPTEWLKMLRVMLSMYAKGISLDLGAAYNAGIGAMNAKLERQFLEPVMHMIDNFFREQREKALSLLDPDSHSDPEAIRTLFLCTPIEEMFTYVLSALQKLQDFVVKYIRRYWELGQLKQVKGSLKIQILGDSKRAGLILKVLNALIMSLDAGNVCAQEDSRTPSQEDISDIINRTSLDLPSGVNIDTGDDPYADFSVNDIKDFTTLEGLPIIQPVASQEVVAAHGLQDCARARISDKNMAEFIKRASQVSEGLANANLE